MKHFKNCFGISTVGTKGQIVIPLEARMQHGIKEGDKMVFFEGPAGKTMVLMKGDTIGKIIRELEESLRTYKDKFSSNATSNS